MFLAEIEMVSCEKLSKNDFKEKYQGNYGILLVS